MRALHLTLTLLATAALLGIHACGSRRDSAGADPVLQLTQLAAPSQLTRSASFDPDDLSVPGGEFDPVLPNFNVAVEHNEALFAPHFSGDADDLSDLGLAVYRVLAGDYAGAPTVDFVWNAQLPAGNAWFAGIANFAADRWDWYPAPASGTTIDLGNVNDYIDGSGEMLIAVAVAGEAQQRLYSLQVGPYEQSDLPIETISLPAGFALDVFAYPVPGARGMCLAPGGTVFAGSRSGGQVFAVSDFNADGHADQVETIVSGFNEPVGVDVRGADLYFSSISEIWRIDDIESDLASPAEPILVSDAFPTEEHHGWKFIRFGPDGKLYVPVGAPCNICDEGDPYAALHRMNPDGSGLELVARGIRNTVGFDWHPVTGELWFTDNGRDLMGDNVPPCELNRVPAGFAGIPHFGYPYFHGSGIDDPDFAAGHDEADYIEPVQDLGPHVAPLGVRFYSGSMFPQEYRGDAFIAEHGSWNRSVPIGARVTRVRVGADNLSSDGYEVFAEGWQDENGDRWGRPVDVLVLPDGSMLVSDDHAGAIYRITYEGA